jgi:hypothetical protein
VSGITVSLLCHHHGFRSTTFWDFMELDGFQRNLWAAFSGLKAAKIGKYGACQLLCH